MNITYNNNLINFKLTQQTKLLILHFVLFEKLSTLQKF